MGKAFLVVEAVIDKEGVVIVDFEFCLGIMQEKLRGIFVIVQGGYIVWGQVVEFEVGQDQKVWRNLCKSQKMGVVGQVGQLQVGVFYCQVVCDCLMLMLDDKLDVFVAIVIQFQGQWFVGMIDVIFNNLCLYIYC